MVARLARLIRRHQPAVIVTYPPNGLSGHPDHIRTHDLVHAALRQIDADRAGAPNDRDPLLYYIAVSRSRLRTLQSGARAALGADAWVPPDEIGAEDADITTVIDIAAHWDNKRQALSAHASQSDARAIADAFNAVERPDATGHVEEYIRASTRSVRHPIEPGFGGTPPTTKSLTTHRRVAAQTSPRDQERA